MLRVAHVGKFYPPVPGGMERVLESLCASTQGKLENHVVAFNTGRSTVDEVVKGVPVTRVGTWGSAGSVPLAPLFASHLRRVKADVMVVHEPNPWALLSHMVARPKMPLAIWYHSEVVRPRLQYQLFYAPMVRRVYDDAARIITSSPALADHASALQRYRDRVAVIPFGIDADGFVPTPAIARRAEQIRDAAAGPVVLFVGRLVPYKGVDVLIRATANLPVSLTIIGDGPMRESWSRLAREEQRDSPVQFTGEVDADELRAQLHACDVFVLPSTTQAEAFGFVQLEAMACGKPVISTSVRSGVAWVNRHEETGLVVPPRDASMLRAAIERLACDASLRSCLGAAGAARVRQEFGLGRMAERFVSICGEVAAP